MAVNLREYGLGDSYGLQSRKYPPRARKRNRFYDEEFDVQPRERERERDSKSSLYSRGGQIAARSARSPSLSDDSPTSPPPLAVRSAPSSRGRRVAPSTQLSSRSRRQYSPVSFPTALPSRRSHTTHSPPLGNLQSPIRRRDVSPSGFKFERSPHYARRSPSPLQSMQRASSPSSYRMSKSIGIGSSGRHHHHERPPRMPYSWGPTGLAAVPSHERRIGQMNATRLRNMLKLPKAHRWVFYEWFYSNLDRPIFLGESDFRMCLRDHFPQLKTRYLSRTQWSLIRCQIGKPRRCSAAFFAEERRALHEKRDKIRKLQMKSAVEPDFVRDLGDDMLIPMPLIIGTRVTARVRYPTDGLYTGMVDAIDSYNHSYRITFDKIGLGTRTIPDYEVLSIMPQETIPIAAYKTQHKASRNLFMSPARLLALSAVQTARQHAMHAKMAGLEGVQPADCPICQADNAKNAAAAADSMGAGSSTTGSNTVGSNRDPPDIMAMLSSGDMTNSEGAEAAAAGSTMTISVAGQPLVLTDTDTYNGYPMKFLVMITKLSKILEVKKRCLEDLTQLHAEAERKVSTQDPVILPFQQRYATTLIHLQRVNNELENFSEQVLTYAKEISQEHGLAPLDTSTEVRCRCDERSQELVAMFSSHVGRGGGGGQFSRRPRRRENLRLVAKLVSSLMQVRMLADMKASAIEMASVYNTLKDIKAGLHQSNVKTFETNVEVHLNHILSGLSEGDNLAAFRYTTTTTYP